MLQVGVEDAADARCYGLDAEILPVLPLQRILLEVDMLETGAGHHRFHVQLCHEILPGHQLPERGYLRQNGRQLDERVCRNVESLQLDAINHLVWQSGDSVMRKIQLCDTGEVEAELGRDLGDDIVRDGAGVELGAPHQVEHGIWNLHQLTLAQVEKSALILDTALHPRHHFHTLPM